MSEATRQRVTGNANGNGASSVAESELNLKTQVSVSMPLGLLFKVEEDSEKDKAGKAITGATVLKIVAAHYGYELAASKRNRTSMTDEQKKERAKEQAAARANKLKDVMARFRAAEAS